MRVIKFLLKNLIIQVFHESSTRANAQSTVVRKILTSVIKHIHPHTCRTTLKNAVSFHGLLKNSSSHYPPSTRYTLGAGNKKM